jgi:hypothetical protein
MAGMKAPTVVQLMGGLLVHRQHDFSDMRTQFHQPVCLGCLAQRERRVDHRRASPGVQHWPDLLPQFGRDLALLRRRARPHRRAGDRQPAYHHLHEVEVLDFDPCRNAIITSRPSMASERMLRGMYGAPTMSSTTSTPPPCNDG